ncbi:MAG: hypothetical protein U0169_24045 [Polyangiaceae bacterium]
MGNSARLIAWLAATCATFTLTAWSGSARAGGMDPVPERLVLQPPGLPAGQTCQSIAYNPEIAVQSGTLPNSFPCIPNHAAFRNIASELGFAIAPTAFHPARTTGFGGLALTLEASFTKINASGETNDGNRVKYWEEGSRGSIDRNQNQFSIRNNAPDSLLQVYALKARKGLPFGFELTTSMGHIVNTELFVMGADVQWSVLEGFRSGALGYLPDVSVGTGVRTLVGSSKMYLTTIGIDARISKPFAIADSAELTPFAGYQRLMIFGNSTIMDFTPNVDPLQQCGYNGPDAETGAPRCRNKLSNGADANADFNNNSTFQSVRIHRHRGLFGLSYKYDIFYVAGQFAVDLSSPDSENNQVNGARQWTLSLEGGLHF